MKQLLSLTRLLSVIVLGAAVAACTSSGQTSADGADAVNLDSAAEAEATLNVDELTEEKLEQMNAGKAFLEQFYKQLDDAEDEEALIRANVSDDALQSLKDSYDYDCESGDCIAFWLLTYNMTDPGVLKKRTVEAVDQKTFKVCMTYDCENGEWYDYFLEIELVKEGENYKIDSIEELKNELYTNNNQSN